MRESWFQFTICRVVKLSVISAYLYVKITDKVTTYQKLAYEYLILTLIEYSHSNAEDYIFGAEDAFKVLNTKYLRLTKMNIDQMEKICIDEGIDVSQLHAHITDKRNQNELMGSVFKVCWDFVLD